MKENNKDYTYRKIRRAIGYLGISLPVFLVVMSAIPLFKTSVQSSVSHYYYTNFREIFTGTLCAVSLFLIRYKGYKNSVFWKNDTLLTNIAGVMALGVAFIPTNPDMECYKIYTLIPYSWEWIGALHYVFAGLLFLIFALLAIFVFTIGQNQFNDLPKSFINENNIYRICGYSIIIFIILIPVFAHFKLLKYSTLVFEALSLFAFGVAWLIKGRALGDKGIIGEKIYREYNVSNTEEH